MASLSPICEHEVKNLGAWKPFTILVDHVAIEAGFSKHSYQAQCVTLESGGANLKFLHLRKQASWFVAAVGGPKLGAKGEMPTVTVIDELTAKVFGGDFKDPETAVAAADTEPAELDDDPMAELDDISPELETPKKTKSRKQVPQRALVRSVDMPTRPLCVQCDAGTKTLQFYCQPKSKKLFIRIQDVDWLISYAADQHHFQGIRRGADVAPETAVAAYTIEWDFNAKAFDVNINTGPHAGLRLTSPLVEFTKDAFDKTCESQQINVERTWSKATTASKRKVSRAYLQMWADASANGSRYEFETEFGCPRQSPTKRQKGDIHSEAADSNGNAGLETAVAALPQCEGDAGAAGPPHENDAESETIVAGSGAS